MLSVLAVVVFSACRSSRHAAKADGGTEFSQIQTNPIQNVGETDGKEGKKKDKKKKKEEKRTNFTGISALTSKMNLTLETEGKKINVGGTYRLKRDEVVQISLTYTMLITINVGTMELTPDYMLFIDRMNKRYCQISYTEIPALAEAGIDFNYLQRIFWGEAESSPTSALEWNYANWTSLGEGQFPGQIRFALKHGNSTYTANFDLSNLRENDEWETRTTVSSKYTQIPFNVAMNSILNLVK